MVKKRIAKIAAAASIVACLGTVSAMAVVDAICEHKDVYIDKLIDNSVSFGDGGHTYHYIGNVICRDCGISLSSYEDEVTEEHSYRLIEIISYDETDEWGLTIRHEIEVYECEICGWQHSIEWIM